MIRIVAKKGKSKKSSSTGKKSSTASKKGVNQKTSSKKQQQTSNVVQYVAGGVVFIAFVVLLLALFSNFNQGEGSDVPSDINQGNLVAVVEGTEIYDSEINQIIEARNQQGSQLSREDALEEIVLREVLLEEIRNRDIYPTVQETEEEITAILSEQGQTLDQFRQTLDQQGTNYDAFIEDQRAGLGFERLGLSLVDTEVTEEESRAFFEENAAALGENASFDEIESSIVEFIQQERANEALVEYGSELATDASVEIVDQEYFNEGQQTDNNAAVVGEDGAQQIEIQ